MVERPSVRHVDGATDRPAELRSVLAWPEIPGARDRRLEAASRTSALCRSAGAAGALAFRLCFKRLAVQWSVLVHRDWICLGPLSLEVDDPLPQEPHLLVELLLSLPKLNLGFFRQTLSLHSPTARPSATFASEGVPLPPPFPLLVLGSLGAFRVGIQRAEKGGARSPPGVYGPAVSTLELELASSVGVVVVDWDLRLIAVKDHVNTLTSRTGLCDHDRHNILCSLDLASSDAWTGFLPTIQ
ncbi:hypothetical protein BJV78DRAFT_1283366 [Lactifluus subvellereus]|nr:hypothetical protein BJV78DRAFT_1283366 [Lactifluus subvellereus]